MTRSREDELLVVLQSVDRLRVELGDLVAQPAGAAAPAGARETPPTVLMSLHAGRAATSAEGSRLRGTQKALARFAVAYADQTTRDHAALLKAIEDGRVQAIVDY